MVTMKRNTTIRVRDYRNVCWSLPRVRRRKIVSNAVSGFCECTTVRKRDHEPFKILLGKVDFAIIKSSNHQIHKICSNHFPRPYIKLYSYNNIEQALTYDTLIYNQVDSLRVTQGIRIRFFFVCLFEQNNI